MKTWIDSQSWSCLWLKALLLWCLWVETLHWRGCTWVLYGGIHHLHLRNKGCQRIVNVQWYDIREREEQWAHHTHWHRKPTWRPRPIHLFPNSAAAAAYMRRRTKKSFQSIEALMTTKVTTKMDKRIMDLFLFNFWAFPRQLSSINMIPRSWYQMMNDECITRWCYF